MEDTIRSEPIEAPSWINFDETADVLEVNVTDREIGIAIRYEPFACLVSQALPFKAYVGGWNRNGSLGFIRTGDEDFYRLPVEVSKLLQSWDRGASIEPFSFVAQRETDPERIKYDHVMSTYNWSLHQKGESIR